MSFETLPQKQEEQKKDKFAKKRVRIMGELRQRMRDVDARVNYTEDELRQRRIVMYDNTTQELFILENGNKVKISYGDIIADYEWGIQYVPDESCPPLVWSKVRVQFKGGKSAQTLYKKLKTFKKDDIDFSLVSVRIFTGRTHQIRVHLAAMGFPIIGDKKYGIGVKQLTPRHFLHSTKLKFVHPKTGQEMTMEAPLPRDTQEFIETSKQNTAFRAVF